MPEKPEPIVEGDHDGATAFSPHLEVGRDEPARGPSTEEKSQQEVK